MCPRDLLTPDCESGLQPWRPDSLACALMFSVCGAQPVVGWHAQAQCAGRPARLAILLLQDGPQRLAALSPHQFREPNHWGTRLPAVSVLQQEMPPCAGRCPTCASVCSSSGGAHATAVHSVGGCFALALMPLLVTPTGGNAGLRVLPVTGHVQLFICRVVSGHSVFLSSALLPRLAGMSA